MPKKILKKIYKLKIYLSKCKAGIVFSCYCDRVSEDLMMEADVDHLMVFVDHWMVSGL